MIVGIDPGVKGAFAGVSRRGEFVFVEDLPLVDISNGVRLLDINRFLDHLRALEADEPITDVIIERQQAFPKQGSSSGFKTGVVYGSCVAAGLAGFWRVQTITPAVWKKGLNLTNDKKASLERARFTFNAAGSYLRRQLDHDRAEALLLAYFGYMRGDAR